MEGGPGSSVKSSQGGHCLENLCQSEDIEFPRTDQKRMQVSGNWKAQEGKEDKDIKTHTGGMELATGRSRLSGGRSMQMLTERERARRGSSRGGSSSADAMRMWMPFRYG